MRKELGKWLTDIAKYVMTAVIISSMFGSIEQMWIIYVLGMSTVVATLICGLWLQKEKKQSNQ